MEIKTENKNEKEYKNIDFRTIPYGNSEVVTKMGDNSFEITTQYGKSNIFNFKYNNEEVSAFVPESFKTKGFGTNLIGDLDKFKNGDMLKITKLEGTTKKGVTFRYFTVEKVGEDKDLKGVNNQQTEVKPNLNFNVSKPKKDNLTNLEQQILDGIKNNKELSKEDRIQIFVQNNVMYSRAVELVNKYF